MGEKEPLLPVKRIFATVVAVTWALSLRCRKGRSNHFVNVHLHYVVSRRVTSLGHHGGEEFSERAQFFLNYVHYFHYY